VGRFALLGSSDIHASAERIDQRIVMTVRAADNAAARTPVAGPARRRWTSHRVLARGAVAPPSSRGYDNGALTSTCRFGCRALAVILLTLGVSHAEGPPQVPTRLIWSGDECGRADDFAARVMQRTHAVRFVSSGERVAVRLAIERREQGGLDASVRIAARGRAAVTRRIRSPDCDDALDALALVVAISVEGRGAPATDAPSPARRTAPARATKPAVGVTAPGPDAPAEPGGIGAGGAPASPPTAASPTTPPAGDAAVAEPEALPAAPVETEPPPGPGEPEPAAPLRPAVEAPPAAESPFAAEPPALEEPDRERLELGAGLSAQMSLGIAPDALFGGAAWLSVGWRRPGVWSPELTASWMYQRLNAFEDKLGDADFALNAASVSLCPLRVGSRAFQARPCATFAGGQLASEGHATYQPRSRRRPWAALGGTVELVAKLGMVELRAAIGAAAPLVRDSFGFGSDCGGAACQADVFHRVEPVIWSGALGAGVGFW
jgi:hypothetical protein